MLTKMSKYFTVWMCFGVLPTLVLTAGAVECSEKDSQLRLRPRPIPRMVAGLTDCLMECTGMTYIRKLQLQDDHNIRLQDSVAGDLGEYCWSKELKCNIGERFLHAYVVLPVDTSAVGYEHLEVKATVPTAIRLQVHNSPTTVADECGLRYAATNHFSTEHSGTLFCVQVVTQENVSGDNILKCPPYLVTFWQRNPNQSIQQGGG